MSLSEHKHCWWCGHVIRPECGSASLVRSDEPEHPVCHGGDHDCHAEASAAEHRIVDESEEHLPDFMGGAAAHVSWFTDCHVIKLSHGLWCSIHQFGPCRHKRIVSETLKRELRESLRLWGLMTAW